jgi:hypothetical protein
MAEPATSAILLKLGVDLVSRPAQTGLAILTTWAAGHEVLVVGPARAGKTSFVEFLQYGVLEKEQETAKTTTPHKSASFRVKIGRSEALELKVRSTMDLPGEAGATEHARKAKLRKPQAIVVILDISAPLAGNSKYASGPWLTTFCKQIAANLRNEPKFKKRLRCLIFVANHYDKLATSSAQRKIDALRSLAEKHLESSFDPGSDCMPFLPCVLVDTPIKSELADLVIVRLAKSLA